MEYKDFCAALMAEADEGFAEFAQKGILTERPILGVRTPRLREMAREIVKRGEVAEFLKNVPVSYEEVVVRGFVIAYLPYEEMMGYFDEFLKLMDNWAVCDMFSATLKSVRKHREEFLEKIDAIVRTGAEFETRTGLVCLLDHYVMVEYLPVIFEYVETVAEREEYYVKMAVAWLVAECFIKFPEITESYLMTCHLPKWTFNKTISKICDSRRVDEDAKQRLKKIRKVGGKLEVVPCLTPEK